MVPVSRGECSVSPSCFRVFPDEGAQVMQRTCRTSGSNKEPDQGQLNFFSEAARSFTSVSFVDVGGAC